MTTYIYFVKCPGCEDEHFDFFDEAKEFALGCLSQKPIITQTEIERNDFGECTDHCDLGTVWSWEDIMGETDAEPAKSIFTKDDLKPWIEDKDSEFDSLDNSVDCEEPILEEARVDHIDSVEATDRKLISLVQDNTKGPLADRVGSSGFYSENGQRFMAIPVSANSDSYDFDSYKKELQQVFPNTDIYCVVDDSEIVIDVTSFYTERKPIPEGMTIEQIVEEMEENEDTVECTLCNDLFDKSTCRKELNLGWLCRRCADDLIARGEGPVFKEDNYWDFLDEDLEELSFSEMVADSINHLVNDLGKDSTTEDFVDDVIMDIERNYDNFVPEDPMNHRKWASAVASEVSRQLNNPDNLTEASLSDIAAAANSEFGTSWDADYLLDKAGVEDDFRRADVHTGMTPSEKIKYDREQEEERAYRAKLARWKKYQKSKQEDLDPEALHDLGNEYDGGYPAETPEVSNSHLKFCPECGTDNTFDIETGVCLKCGFIV